MWRHAASLGGAMLLHGALCLLTWRLPVSAAVEVRAPAVELEVVSIPPVAALQPAIAPSLHATRVSSHRATATREVAPSQSQPQPGAAGGEAAAPPVIGGGGGGTPDLFPRGVLEKLAGTGSVDRAPGAPGQLTPGQRVDRWAREAAAEARAQSGQVRHEWRQVERELVQGFHPPVSVVHEEPSRTGARIADRLRSLALQTWMVTVRGPEGIRHPNVPGSRADDTPSSRSIDPSQQGYQGDAAGLNLRAMPIEQSFAAVRAQGDPVSWLRVEVEVETDAAGEIRSAKVVVPSGRRAFDRYALAAVSERVAHAVRDEAAISRWLVEAAYSVGSSGSFSLSFDENALFDRRARGQTSLDYLGKQNVQTRVSLRWVMPP